MDHDLVRERSGGPAHEVPNKSGEEYQTSSSCRPAPQELGVSHFSYLSGEGYECPRRDGAFHVASLEIGKHEKFCSEGVDLPVVWWLCQDLRNCVERHDTSCTSEGKNEPSLCRCEQTIHHRSELILTMITFGNDSKKKGRRKYSQ